MICMADVFSAIVVYRTSVLQKRPTRRDGTYKQRIEWSHPCFDEAKKIFYRMNIYRDHGLKHFVLHTGITSALKNNQIILGSSGHDLFNSDFVSAMAGCFIDLSSFSHFSSTIIVLHKIILNIPSNQWDRVAKISMAHSDGIPIEFTSSTHSSLAMWAISQFTTDYPNNPDEYSELLRNFENHITTCISEFAQNSNLHIVRMQPGALRSKPGTVPQRAHRDFRMHTYKEKFPNQLYIGFMPVTPDGMFLQVWNAPGEAKLIFVPFGQFLLLPGNTIHAGWMCTSLSHYNYRLHFYILVSKEPNYIQRHENIFFENMNSYLDEESPNQDELFKNHWNCLAKSTRTSLDSLFQIHYK
jgi:hypothetical protein